MLSPNLRMLNVAFMIVFCLIKVMTVCGVVVVRVCAGGYLNRVLNVSLFLRAALNRASRFTLEGMPSRLGMTW